MDGSSRREQLYEVFADRGRPVGELVADALDIGRAYLDLPIGFLTRIEDGTQTIIQSTGDHELIQPGESCPLDDAYCRRTVELDGHLAVHHASASEAVSQTALRTFGLETYVGAKVLVDDEVYGTVCFASQTQRDAEFDTDETVFIEVFAKLVGQAIERRRYERELEQRNERLQREKARIEGIAETSFDILFQLDLDGEFTYVSPAVEQTLGYAPGTLVGSPFADIIVQPTLDDALVAYADALEGEPAENVELDFVDADGERVVIEVNATPVTDDGEIVGIQGVGRDVTEQKRRERELRLKNRAMDEADIGISIAEAGGDSNPLLYVNEGFERVTGYGADEALGRDCRFLQGEATDPDRVATLREHIDAEEPVLVELINYREDGTPFWNQVQVSPVEDDDGEVTQFLGFQTDITERKRTEQLVQLLNRVLRHNLRNDMNALLGFGDLLREGTGEPTAVGSRIVSTAESLVHLTEQARELERYARYERDPRRLDTDAMLAALVDEQRERFPDATVELDCRTERAVCAGVELEQALTELVENGLKHDPSSAPCVRVTAADEGDWVVCTVADDGPGIDEMEAHVISKGQESALEHGSGLGLWLVNWIVTRYGGSFQIRGGDDGTVATVRLPAIEDGQSVADVARSPTVLFR
ncbi:PAS domain S-box protein [Haloarchaeobius iranensis]|uniref:histidine kinase n=1 Tax=Haloarchaeobius iranensis TaxID=996166 RepID=A0A1H0AUV5_9EURY|nr:PAS domain S-box protein [Haloarchaeobius iranensis]SDN37169.1 PAS domain S-box-containing protein [Haloarchaeobius iranensis]